MPRSVRISGSVLLVGLVLASAQTLTAAAEDPSSHGLRQTMARRPPACRSSSACRVRRVEVFRVTVTGTQTTTWQLRPNPAETSICAKTAEGMQTIRFDTRSPQPAALWIDHGEIGMPPGPIGGRYDANHILFAGLAGNPSVLYDGVIQEGFRGPPPSLPVRMDVDRRYEYRIQCAGSTSILRGSDCGARQPVGLLDIYVTKASLSAARPFVVWGGDRKVYGSGGSFDPYADCTVYPGSNVDDDQARSGCLKSNLATTGGAPGKPFWTWVGASQLLLLADDNPRRPNCLTGASPRVTLRDMLDCTRRRIVISQPGFEISDADPNEEYLYPHGWTSTTRIEWQMTFARVGCGRVG